MNIRKVDPFHPEPEIIAEASRSIQTGGVVAFPTRCLFGLAADALNPVSVERVFQIKQRPPDKPVLVLIKKRTDLSGLVKSIPSTAKNLIDVFWPGRITIIFKAKDALSEVLTARTGKIGVRIPGHPVAVALVNTLNHPITGTSANLSGHTGCSRISELSHDISDKLDLILDAGPLRGGVGSTVVDVTVNPPKVIRHGEVSEKAIFSALGEKS
ncbi:L-threonylcarbamoyladenylate synthase [Thermodesulfobacteriota bacterium]